MAITKQQKKDLIQGYITDLGGATNTVIVQQNSISVPTATKVRKQVALQDGKFSVVRKRLFLRAMKEAGLEEIGLDQLDGSILAVYAHSDEFGPLKAVNKFLKEFAKENKGAQFTFLGGWFEKKWQGPEYVNELANVPTKEELLAKLCYLFKYPLQSFACALNEVAKKDSSVVATEGNEEVPQGGKEVAAEVEETPAAPEATLSEEAKEEIKEEIKEEVVEEIKEEVQEIIEDAIQEAVEEIKEETAAE